jgi:hypothetical protein
MAQAARSLPSAFIPENTENASESAVFVPSYVLQSKSGLYLTRYTIFGGNWSARQCDAKVFYVLARAEATARLFNCDIRPGPRDPKARLGAASGESNVAMLARLIIESSKIAAFSGIQRGFTRKKITHPPLVLFSSVKTGATLALPIRKLSRSSVIAAVEASDKTFERYAEVASRRVFFQFSKTGANAANSHSLIPTF